MFKYCKSRCSKSQAFYFQARPKIDLDSEIVCAHLSHERLKRVENGLSKCQKFQFMDFFGRFKLPKTNVKYWKATNAFSSLRTFLVDFKLFSEKHGIWHQKNPFYEILSHPRIEQYCLKCSISKTSFSLDGWTSKDLIRYPMIPLSLPRLRYFLTI